MAGTYYTNAAPTKVIHTPVRASLQFSKLLLFFLFIGPPWIVFSYCLPFLFNFLFVFSEVPKLYCQHLMGERVVRSASEKQTI